jgi:hypothetical protein
MSHFNHRTHSPSVFTDGHGAEVDIWGVGHLILSCDALDISEELRKLGRMMKKQGEGESDEKMSAQEALNEIREYQIRSHPSQ